MRELNEMELEQVAGGWSFSKGTGAIASGTADAGAGFASSSSHTGSVNDHGFSASWASNHSSAFGYYVDAASGAASTAGVSVNS